MYKISDIDAQIIITKNKIKTAKKKRDLSITDLETLLDNLVETKKSMEFSDKIFEENNNSTDTEVIRIELNNKSKNDKFNVIKNVKNKIFDIKKQNVR